MTLFQRVAEKRSFGPHGPGGSRRRESWLTFLGILMLAFLFLGAPPAASKSEDEEPDYPRLFSELARNLNLHYLDLERIHPRPLIEKAFSAIENAAEEVYVENSDPTNPIVSLHVGSKAQAFNLNSVENLDEAIQMLENVFEFLKTHYQGESTLNDIRYAAANGFLNGLDPHTLVFSPDAFKDFSVHIEGEIFGVGMYVGSKDGKLVVIEVLKGDTVPTPAFKAGFKKGDIIAKIGDESTINMSVPEAVDKIRGPRHSTVTLTVKRASVEDAKKLETHVISVQRDRVEIKSVEAKLIPNWNKDGTGPWKGGVGYVKVENFDKNTTRSLRLKLDDLVKENGGPLAGLVLDLRDNSGGLLQQAIEMTDLFLKKGDIVITASRGKSGSELLEPKSARDDGTEPEYPIVVLSNEASASGAEIVIGALQKNNRALVLGTRTFGKGSVQQLHALRNGAQLKITVSEYLIPGKISIQENGVVPDILAKAVRFEDGDNDLFTNERSLTEKNYETHIVSRFAKEEKPSYLLDYYHAPAKEDPYTNRFMSGELEPEKDKLVQVALKMLALGEKPFAPASLLKTKGAAVEEIEDSLFQEIVQELKARDIDWSAPPRGEEAGTADAAKLDVSLTSTIISEPSEDPEDPVAVNKLVVTARLTNKGEKPLYRMKGLSKSDYFLYKDQEFLFGKVNPGQTVSRDIKIRLPYFPHARNDIFTVEVSSTSERTAVVERLESPAAPPADRVLVSGSIQIELADKGRPAFAYSAELREDKTGKPLSSLKPRDRALLNVKVKNIGNAPAHKGVTILRNENGRQIFLNDRPEFTNLVPGGEVQAEISFEVNEGDATEYEFELIIVDSYSGASLTRKLTIARGGKDDAKPFPQGVAFAPPAIEVVLLDPETRKPVILTGRDSLKLEAVIRSPDTDPFKTWIFNSALGSEHDTPPDKIFYADSRGEPQLKIATSVPLKKGVNLFTVVTNDRNGLESRQNIVVRRE